MARGGLLGYTVWQSQHGSRWWFEWGDLTSKWLSTKFRGTWFWGNLGEKKKGDWEFQSLSLLVDWNVRFLQWVGCWQKQTDDLKDWPMLHCQWENFGLKNGCFTDPDRSQIHDPSLCPNANALRPQRLQHQALWIRLDAIDKVLVVLDLRAVASVEHSV